MIAKAKAISYGINDLRYITGESKHKKHPEKIYRVLDNLLPPELDATGIWNSMQLTYQRNQSFHANHSEMRLSPRRTLRSLFTRYKITRLSGKEITLITVCHTKITGGR